MSRNRLSILAAALAFAAAPAFAQTNATTAAPSSSNTGASTADDTSPMQHHGRTHAMHGYSGSRASRGASGHFMPGRASSADHSADQLNAQSLAAIQGGGMMTPGSSMGAGSTMGTGSTTGTGGTTWHESGHRRHRDHGLGLGQHRHAALIRRAFRLSRAEPWLRPFRLRGRLRSKGEVDLKREPTAARRAAPRGSGTRPGEHGSRRRTPAAPAGSATPRPRA